MNNNVYVRNKTSIRTISLARIIFLIPLIVYGFYKNGIYLYLHGYVNILGMFKPLILIGIGLIIGALVNIIYEKAIIKNKSKLIDVLFSSFHIEYGIILACISSINTNILIFSLSAFILFILSKILKNRINIISLTFIAIYLITIIKSDYTFTNAYELSKSFQLNIFDYLIGRAPGGIASTHIILIAIALTGLYITNNNKFSITINACINYAIPTIIFCIITNTSILNALFLNNYMFIFSFVATDMVTSCYTNNGKKVFGILVGLLTFGFSFLNPIIAPFISIIIVSLFNNYIDRKVNKMKVSHD